MVEAEHEPGNQYWDSYKEESQYMKYDGQQRKRELVYPIYRLEAL